MHRWLGGCLVLIIANLALAQTGPLVPQELLDQLQASEPQGLPRNMTPQEALLPLHDISVGGIGIVAAQALNFDQLEKLESCWIDLRESGMLNVTLEVRYVSMSESRTGKPVWHMGCKFDKLSPANETLIQRFMARIEAERHALSAG